ncbi:MAG: hypothetical protein DRH57_08230 [Candidatus Cloacimonadota bacterium]|nr:MAG: hypothetical protein DRH57_08230 [Candidatus Cloacimonadota bacterium]
MNIDFKDLDTLQKYFYNRVNYTEFEEAMMTVYNDKNYIEPLWPQFRDNGVGFLVSRSETKVFDYFCAQIEKTGYKG